MNRLLSHYKQVWHLSNDGDPFTTHSSLLQPVIYDSRPYMLKIATVHEERRVNQLMHWWNGEGAAPVLQYDDIAILMERAMGSRSLTEMVKNGQDDEASHILCDVAGKLHSQKGPCPKDLVSLLLWFKSLKVAADKYSGIFTQCNEIANELLSNPQNTVVLHGDIHHGNILDFGGKGWLAIDPKGLLGERGFDYANLFCNPDVAAATDLAMFTKRARLVSKAAVLEPKRLLQWIVAWAGLSAAWAMEDGESAEPAMTVAKIALSALNDIV